MMILGGFPVIMDTTVVNVALPSILSGFETSLGRAQLVVSMYMIAIALVIPLTGYLADRIGEKTLYMICVCGFTAGSALCGIAWDINSLIFFRVIQGLAGGITMPLGIAMLFRAVPRNEIGAMTGWAGLVMVLAPVFGPLVSGYLVDTSSWRLVFWVNVPTGIIAVIMTRAILQDTDRIANLPFDYKGFVLAGVGFCTALLALTRVAQDGWTSNVVIGMLLVSCVAIVGWIFVELNERTPLLDLKVFRNSTYSLAMVVYLTSNLITFPAMFLLPLFLQSVRGLTPIQTGMLLMPEAVAMMIALPIVGRVYDKFGPLPLIIPGLVGMGYSMFGLRNITMDTAGADMLIFFIMRGVCQALISMPAFTLALSVHPREAVARASAIINVLRMVFPAFSIAIFATILQSRTHFHTSTLAQTVTPDSLGAMQVLSGLRDMVGQAGSPDAMAMWVLDGIVRQQAAIKGFNDVFLLATFVVLIGVVPTLFLRKPSIEETPAVSATPAAEPAD